MVKLLSFSASITALTTLATTVSGQFETPADKALIKRDTSAYAPQTVACPPQNPTIRSGASISQNETSWLQQRRSNTIPAMRDFLSRANITGFDVNSYFNAHSGSSGDLPNIGIAVSGGGWRALMIGAGALSAFDNRTANATATGHLGGLLQSATYLAGLSGGSWLVGSLYKNNFDSVSSILGGQDGLGNLWQFDQSILEGPDTISALSYYTTVFGDVHAKSDAGFNTTLTDYWGRFLSFQLFNATTGSPDFTFTQIANSGPFANANTPMPLIIADERQQNQLLIASNATIFEFNPWEMGSYDPGVVAFAPLQYIGSNFTGGSASGDCVVGFDNIGFVVGTSSSLFNQFYLQINNTGSAGIIRDAISDILARIGEANDDISLWPNPFYGYNAPTNAHANSNLLTLVDGGEDLQNIPFHPLIRSARDVDVIFAVDGSADTTTNWPNGTAILATSEASREYPNELANGFPNVPDTNTFVNLGLNNRPTFFGCENNGTKNMPLVVYLPNAPYTYDSNASTFTLETTDMDRNAMIANAYNMATQANSTRDRNWPRCVGCAIMKRSWSRTNTTIPAVCNQCFTNYCWNGTTNSTMPLTYEPTLIVEGAAAANSGAKKGAAVEIYVPSSVAGVTFMIVALFQLFL